MKQIVFSAALLMGAILMTASCGSRGNLNFESIDKSEWMTLLPDEMPGCEISIPGAHDACTVNVDEEYCWFRTQVLDIQQMWDAGVRSFDLRPAARGETLSIFHDRADTYISFEEVIGILEDNLEKHPGEFAVVIFRHEREADTTPNWESLMGEFLRSGLREGVALDFRDDLTLGELRGHIIFLGRRQYEGGPVGGYISDWDDYPVYEEDKHAWVTNAAGGKFCLRVQDHYGPEGAADKIAAVTSLMDAVAQKPVWSVNHTSGYASRSKSYGENAQNVNAAVAEHIASLDGHAGIVVMDFAAADFFTGPYVEGREIGWDYTGPVGSREWNVAGAQLVDALIRKNF